MRAVETCKYLGSVLAENCSLVNESKHRVNCGCMNWRKMSSRKKVGGGRDEIVEMDVRSGDLTHPGDRGGKDS